MSLKTIGVVFGASQELRALAAAARALQALQQAYAAAAPAPLVAASRIRHLRGGTLTIAADNAAAAAKLRQLAPSLLAAIRGRAPTVAALRIEVDIEAAAAPRPPESRKATLGPAAVERFARLAAHTPPGSLRQALERLVRHHRRGASRTK